MPLIELDKLDELSVTLSLRDALEPSDYIYGDDRNAPLGEDDEPLAWEGEIIDGYPIEEKPMKEILRQKKKARLKMELDQQAEREIAHVRHGSERVAYYVARLRAARGMKLEARVVHDLYYDGCIPKNAALLAEHGFPKEARFAMAGRFVTAEGDEGEAPAEAPEAASPQDSEGTEACLRGRAGGRARQAEYLKMADDMTNNLAAGDTVKLRNSTDDSDVGTVQTVNSDGSLQVQRAQGGNVTYDKDSSVEVERKTSKIANVPDPLGEKIQTHLPKGVRKADDDKDHGDENDGWLHPVEKLIATLKWPNVTKLSAAIPKLGARSWFDGIDKAVARNGGAWSPDFESYELEASFPTKESARRFAARLIAEFYVQPTAIEASMCEGGDRYMKMGYLRVDMARRVILPGGVVFALEASVQPADFRANDPVIVMDPQSQMLAEATVASIGPEIVVVITADGTQYEYGRGFLRRLTLAKLSLLHVSDTDLPLGTKVAVGKREGKLAGWNGSDVRIRFDDGPRWVPRAAAVAEVRVADLR